MEDRRFISHWRRASAASSTAAVVVLCGLVAAGFGASQDEPIVAAATSVSTAAATTEPAVTQGSVTAPATLSDVVDRMSGAIRIEATLCDGISIGTGVLIDEHLVATVEHVVDGAIDIVLKRKGEVLGKATVIGSDRERDIALLRTGASIDGYQFQLAGAAPRVGDDVAALGFPLGLPLT